MAAIWQMIKNYMGSAADHADNEQAISGSAGCESSDQDNTSRSSLQYIEFKIKNGNLIKYLEEGNEEKANELISESHRDGTLKELMLDTGVDDPRESAFNIAIRNIPKIAETLMDCSVMTENMCTESMCTGKRCKHWYRGGYLYKCGTPLSCCKMHGKIKYDYYLLDTWKKDIQDITNYSTEEEKYFMSSQGSQPLVTMIQFQRYNLLRHPLINAAIHKKWNTYGYIIYLIQLANFFFTIYFLGAFIFLHYTNPYSFDASKNIKQLAEHYNKSNCSSQGACVLLKQMSRTNVYKLHVVFILHSFLNCYFMTHRWWNASQRRGPEYLKLPKHVYYLTLVLTSIAITFYYMFLAAVYSLDRTIFTKIVSEYTLEEAYKYISYLAIVAYAVACLALLHEQLSIIGKYATIFTSVMKNIIIGIFPIVLIIVYFSYIILYLMLYADLDKFDSYYSGFVRTLLWTLKQSYKDESFYNWTHYDADHISEYVYPLFVIYLPIVVAGFILSVAVKTFDDKKESHLIKTIRFLIYVDALSAYFSKKSPCLVRCIKNELVRLNKGDSTILRDALFAVLYLSGMTFLTLWIPARVTIMELGVSKGLLLRSLLACLFILQVKSAVEFPSIPQLHDCILKQAKFAKTKFSEKATMTTL